jgi:hypothetical protein
MNVDYASHKGCVITPTLLPVIAGVFAKAPNITFVAYSIDANRMIDGFKSYSGGYFLGALCLARKQKKDGGRVAVIRVESGWIKKQRGRNRDAKDTENHRVAVKICLDAFRLPSMSREAKVITDDASSNCYMVHYRAKTAVFGPLRGEDSIEKLARFAIASIAESDSVAVERQAVAQLLEVNKITERLPDLDAAKQVVSCYRNTHGMVLKASYGDAYLAVDLKSPDVVFVVKSSYELPTNYQEKLAILKLMERDTAINNVGIKYEGGEHGYCFFLTGGDTI